MKAQQEWHEDSGPPPGVGRTRLLPEEDGPWATTEITCFICNSEWLDIHPVAMRQTECPDCDYPFEIEY